jgi:hypothetical protein
VAVLVNEDVVWLDVPENQKSITNTRATDE